MKLLILTTAINRPELHTMYLKSIKQLFTNNIMINWIINIDFIPLLKSSLLDTKSNFETFFENNKNVNFEFILNEQGNFNKAVRTIITRSKKYINKIDAVLYLEDDWIVGENYNNDTFEDLIILLKEKKLTNILLTEDKLPSRKYAYFGLNPKLWNPIIFKNIMINVFEENKSSNFLNIDPELFIYKYYKKNKGKVCDKYKHIIYKKIKFKDIGREWIKNKNFIKWNKLNKDKIKTYILK